MFEEILPKLSQSLQYYAYYGTNFVAPSYMRILQALLLSK